MTTELELEVGLLGYTTLDPEMNNYYRRDHRGRLEECELTYGRRDNNAYIHAKADDTSVDEILRSFTVHVTEHTPLTSFVAYGNVILNTVNGDIYVNGVKDALLTDKYDDCFNIRPDMYRHILMGLNVNLN